MNKTINIDNKKLYLFEHNNVYFIYDVNALDIYSISCEMYYKIINAQNQMKISEIFDNSLENDINYEKIIESKPHLENVPLHTIALEVSNDCNLRCKYCYGDGGTYGGEKCFMTTETAFKCIDFLISNSRNSKKLSVIFFGGEPLMNFGVIKDTVNYCNKIKEEKNIDFSYGMTTNAILINEENANFFKKNNFFITVSIDGPKEVHDENRYFINRTGSYDLVESAIKLMMEKNIRLRARATINSTSLKLYDIEKHFEKMGFSDIVLSFVDTDSTSNLYIEQNKFSEIYKEIDRLGEKCIDQLSKYGKTKINMFNTVLERLYYHRPATRSCGAGSTYMAFTADGSLYPCHRFSNWKEYYLGDYTSSIINNQTFIDCSVLNREKCENCFGKFICGGNCMHSSALFGKSIFDIDTHYCDILRKVMQTSIYIYYSAKNENSNVFKELFENK
ncbi:radical SAM protein [Thomasclavelia sp.]